MAFMAALPSIISAAGSVGGAAIGGALAGKKSPWEQAAGQQQLTNMQKSAQFSDSMQPYARSMFDTSTLGTQALLNYYLPLMQGDRRSAMTALSPNIQQANQQLDAGERSRTTLTPRGGGRVIDPMARPSLITNMLLQARNQGAQGLSGLAGQAAGAGGSIANAITGGYGTSAGSARSMLDFELGRQQNEMQAGSGWGSMIANILNSPTVSGWLGKIGQKPGAVTKIPEKGYPV